VASIQVNPTTVQVNIANDMANTDYGVWVNYNAGSGTGYSPVVSDQQVGSFKVGVAATFNGRFFVLVFGAQ
jgi:hypothetical protein